MGKEQGSLLSQVSHKISELNHELGRALAKRIPVNQDLGRSHCIFSRLRPGQSCSATEKEQLEQEGVSGGIKAAVKSCWIWPVTIVVDGVAIGIFNRRPPLCDPCNPCSWFSFDSRRDQPWSSDKQYIADLLDQMHAEREEQGLND